MMMTTKTQPVWQYLKQSAGGHAVIYLKEGEPLVLPMDDLVHACRSWEKAGAFSQQITDLLECLGKWLLERRTEIDRAFLALEPDGCVFAVVRKDKMFDPDFEDALSELDLDLGQNEAFSLINLRVIALPFTSDNTVSSFLDLGRAWVYAPNEEQQ
jgi:hypothetical protein